MLSSPFGGIPRNWKRLGWDATSFSLGSVPPSGGSLEIGNPGDNPGCCFIPVSSPFGGIPRNWKLTSCTSRLFSGKPKSSPFGGIPRNWKLLHQVQVNHQSRLVPPSGGSLEIGNFGNSSGPKCIPLQVPPSGGSLEIGNPWNVLVLNCGVTFPLRGDP